MAEKEFIKLQRLLEQMYTNMDSLQLAGGEAVNCCCWEEEREND